MTDEPQIVPPRPSEAAPETAPRGPLALIGTYAIGFAMGGADVVPAFSGGTVALVAGIYERFVANVRQGAHVLSLLLRGKPDAALRAFLAIEWPFVGSLLAGILTAILALSATLGALLDRYPRPMAAVFLGLVLGATVVAQRELRSPRWYHAIVALIVAGLVFYGLGWSPGTVQDPSLLLVFGAAAVAVCAMILPGVSGAFLLLVLGMYDAVFLDGFGQRNVVVMLTVVVGAATGLALFSTALNYLLRRWHDLILAALLGLMLGSARVLWPWPDGMDSSALAGPTGNEGLLAFSIGLAAFAVIWLLALVIPSSKEARERSEARAARARDERASGSEGRGAPPDTVQPTATHRDDASRPPEAGSEGPWADTRQPPHRPPEAGSEGPWADTRQPPHRPQETGSEGPWPDTRQPPHRPPERPGPSRDDDTDPGRSAARRTPGGADPGADPGARTGGDPGRGPGGDPGRGHEPRRGGLSDYLDDWDGPERP